MSNGDLLTVVYLLSNSLNGVTSNVPLDLCSNGLLSCHIASPCCLGTKCFLGKKAVDVQPNRQLFCPELQAVEPESSYLAIIGKCNEVATFFFFYDRPAVPPCKVRTNNDQCRDHGNINLDNIENIYLSILIRSPVSRISTPVVHTFSL